MPHIFPLQGQKHTDVTRELTNLGGARQETFRLAFAWDGTHFFELTENEEGVALYEKWINVQVDEPVEEPPATGDQAPPAALADATEQTSAAENIDPSSAAAGRESLPQPSRTLDAPQLPDNTEEPQASSAARTAAKPEDATKPSPSNSGTTRKRSAKNSNRRS